MPFLVPKKTISAEIICGFGKKMASYQAVNLVRPSTNDFVLDEGDPFPSYAIVLLVLGGAVVAVVMGATALHNFKRWREGEFTPKEEETQPQVGQVSSNGTSSDEPST
jgi:hypothetical protein